MLSYLKQLNILRNSCKLNNLKLVFVGKNILKDYVGMNSEASTQMGFKMPSNCIYILRGLSDKIKVHTLRHELIEYGLVRKGMGYWKAHCIALRNENTSEINPRSYGPYTFHTYNIILRYHSTLPSNELGNSLKWMSSWAKKSCYGIGSETYILNSKKRVCAYYFWDNIKKKAIGRTYRFPYELTLDERKNLEL